MKLRNKKTGEIRKAEAREDGIYLWDELTGHWWKYELDLLASSWEYYAEPKEPLIKDEKSRKVFQEWVKLYDAERFRVTHLFNSKGHITVLRSTDLTTEPSIELPNHIGKDSEIYTIAELCGEGEE